MKALLLKDFYALSKQFLIYVLFMLIFTGISGYSSFAFILVFASIIPLSAMAYDERDKWNRLANMMPYTRFSMVFSKYALGYLTTFAGFVITIVVKNIANIVKGESTSVDFYIIICAILCVSTIFQALSLPFIFKLGVEKGRFAFFAFIGFIAIVAAMFEPISNAVINFIKNSSSINMITVALIAFGGSVILNVLSVFLSIKLFSSTRK